jgi:hypothetical protein
MKTLPRLAFGLAVVCLSPGRANSDDSAKWWKPAESATVGLPPAVLGQHPDVNWSIAAGATAKEGGPFTVEDDPLLGRKVLVCGAKPLTLEGRTTYGEVEIDCRVRLGPTPERPSTAFSLVVAKDPADKASRGIPIALTGTLDGGLSINALGTGVPYKLRAYDRILPTWDDSIRIPIEHDMAQLPVCQDKWVHVRCRLAKDSVRIWVDDRLLVDRRDPALKTTGVVRVALQPGTRLAEMSLHSLPAAEPNFETVPLDGYVRDRTLVQGAAVAPDALPFGQTVLVDGIPFSFAAREGKNAPDHLDVGRSVLRQANMEGYLQSGDHRFAGAFWVDPARIQLRIPNGRYDALHLVAAFDGEENNIPELNAMFYRPGAGFAQAFECTVPRATDQKAADARPLPIRLDSGSRANLWLIRVPLDPALLASFSDMETLELELTKRVHQYRSYPDPILYGWHGAGLPSGVHVYALTLHRAEIEMSLEPAAVGHVWTTPAVPAYSVAFENRSTTNRTLSVLVETKSHDGGETTKQTRSLNLLAGKQGRLNISVPVKKNGWHEMTLTMTDGERSWSERRNFVRLAKDTRAPFWEEGKGPMFGYWSYHGGHHTPPALDTMKLMHAAGARGTSMHAGKEGSPEQQLFTDWKWRAGPNAWAVAPQRGWASGEKPDPALYEAYKTTAVEALRKVQGDNPEIVTFFAEPHISHDLTAGNLPDYWGEPPYQLNADEQRDLRTFMNTARSAAEGVRAAWPGTKILIPWGDPLFVVPLLRAGFPKNLIDGSGLDMIGFERLPEQQLGQMSTHRLYMLREEYKKFGLPNPMLAYIEGTFVPTEPGACTWEEQAERYHRWTLLSLAYGVDRFYSGWFSHDCGNYYGSEHYGGCGIFRRIPCSDPKPGYAHYATMTRMLERSKFEKWLPTGSLTSYALKFTKPDAGAIYTLWNVRGKRTATLTLEKDGAVTVTDSMDNATVLKSANRTVTVPIGTSPVYITGAGEVQSISLGAPDNSDSVAWSRNRNQETWQTGPAKRRAPIEKEVAIANLGDGSWTLTAERDSIYEDNCFDTKPYLGKMSAKVTSDDERKGNFLAVHLLPQEKERKLMPWYSVLKPRKPLVIAGKPAALGLWVKASSDWGRVVYSLRDAKGERWLSTGTKDQWNCNDVHGWSAFNFDGWRYVRFELPGHSEWDTFREFGTTWWGSTGGDGIVDLPLRIESIIVERRTHVLYVNDVQPANPADVLLGELVAEYESASDSAEETVVLNQLRMPRPRGEFALANPIAKLQAGSEFAPVKLERIKMPDWGYDGTRCHVEFTTAPDAAEYQVWVSAYPDGRGAVQMGRMKTPGGLVGNLRPAMKLHLWVTYSLDPSKGGKPQGALSKPSNRLEIQLVDAFSQK